MGAAFAIDMERGSTAREHRDINVMEYTELGRTGLSVSRVGVGGGGIGQVWGTTTDAEAARAVHRALELGVNFFDVAPSYGNGKAEEVLGWALEGRQEPVIVATKIDKVPRSKRPRGLASIRQSLELAQGAAPIAASASSGEGMKHLWSAISDLLEHAKSARA